jgi:hypothetical protein
VARGFGRVRFEGDVKLVDNSGFVGKTLTRQSRSRIWIVDGKVGHEDMLMADCSMYVGDVHGVQEIADSVVLEGKYIVAELQLDNAIDEENTFHSSE